MALSEEETRLLEQMERALLHDDPKFAHALRGTAPARASRKRAVLGALVLVLGIAMLLGGAYFQTSLLGVLGFVVMLTGATLAMTALQAGAAAGQESAAPDPTGSDDL